MERTRSLDLLSPFATPEKGERLRIPQTIRELRIPAPMVLDLALRYIREHGVGSLMLLRKTLKISHAVADEIFQQLRQQLLIDIKGTVGNDYQFTLTKAGNTLAVDRSETCRYAGPVPVSLDQYREVVRSQRAFLHPSPEAVKEALKDLVVTEDFLDQLGPALASQKPLFIYGPTGNGKTSVIERLANIYEDSILLPYAVEVDAHIIMTFDPMLHRPVAKDDNIDPRWIRCRRPCVMAGGELVPSMLDLRLDESSGVYAPPLQMKANNGILLIDDLGRQAISPRDLLNRWMLPLDRHIDYLSLRHGMTFQIPFEMLLAFSTNLDPAELADDAFLRRIPNKLYIEPISPPVFDEIFRRFLKKHDLPFDPEMSTYLQTICEKYNSGGLHACYPQDICDILAARAAYSKQPMRLTASELDFAARLYFARTKALRD